MIIPLKYKNNCIVLKSTLKSDDNFFGKKFSYNLNITR